MGLVVCDGFGLDVSVFEFGDEEGGHYVEIAEGDVVVHAEAFDPLLLMESDVGGQVGDGDGCVGECGKRVGFYVYVCVRALRETSRSLDIFFSFASFLFCQNLTLRLTLRFFVSIKI